MKCLDLLAVVLASAHLHLLQGVNVSQPQGSVEAIEGSTVTLICVMPSETPPGPARWYKGNGSERTHFYSGAPKGGDKNDPRVNWTMENMTVNYSITIRDLRVSDTGEYYCVKFTKGDNESKPYASGPGVKLTVRGTGPSNSTNQNTNGTGPSNSTNQTTNGNSVKIAVGVLSAIIIIVCIIGVTIWYFRKKAKGKGTLSKSSSSSDGSASPPVNSKDVEVTYAELDSKNFQSRQKRPKENEEEQLSTPEMSESVIYASLQPNKDTSKSARKTKRAQEATLYY